MSQKAKQILKKQILLIVVIIFITLVGLYDNSWSKTGSVSITSPANNSTFTSNFTVGIGAPLGWTNGVLYNGIYNTYQSFACIYTTFYPKLDFYYNGSKFVVGKLVYSIDGGSSITVQDMFSDVSANFTIPVNVISLSAGNHSITITSKDVYSTMNQGYYGGYNGTGCLTNCTSCHANLTGTWQRQDGATIANATLNFTVSHSVPGIPTNLSPAKRFFTGSTSNTSVSFQWTALPTATSYKLNILDAITGSLVQEATPTTASFNTSSLQPLHRYSWKAAGVNSIGTGTFTEARKFLIGPSMECWPEIGTGNGYDIETCYDVGSGTENYLMKDISRRANMNVVGPSGVGHNGHMSDTSAIITQSYVATGPPSPMMDTNNNWADAGQKSGVDAHVNTGKVYDYLNSQYEGLYRFYVPPPSYISILLYQNSMVNIVESQASECPNAFWDPRISTPTVSYCAGFAYSSSLGIVGHEWAHAVTGRASSRGYNGVLGNSGEGGAMDEAFSDWMATAIKQAPPNNDNSWLMTFRYTTRDLSNPLNSSPPQPVWYGGANWIKTFPCTPTTNNDYCGVHQNTGVPNKMFYILSVGGEGVQAIGIDKAIQIAYKANIEKWKITPTPLIFRDARKGMIEAASDLYGALSTEVSQVNKAWSAVGVTATSTPEVMNAKKVMPTIINIVLDL